MNLQENIVRIKEMMGLIVESNGTSYDAVLVGGLDYRSTDYPISKQVDILKKGLGSNKNVKGFRYNSSTSEILKFLKMNPKIMVFLFSAGCAKALELSNSPFVDKNKMYIIEPYAVSKGTKSSVNSAVSNGVPPSNVFVGDSKERGKGIVSGESDSGSSSHWGSLTSVGSKMSSVVVTNTNTDKKETQKNDITTNQNSEISYTFNPKIQELQKQLIQKGYYIGKYGENNDGVDGKYGPMTKAAHEAFKNGIGSDDFNKNRVELSQKHIADVQDSNLSEEFNFHLIPDGKNNYRSAQIPITINGKDFLGGIIDRYGIKTIIRLNGNGRDSKHKSSHPETSIETEKEFTKSKGIEFYKLSSTRDQEKVNSLLSRGNVLIHCAHGADRTGGNVGGYLYKNLGWDTEKTWNYTTKYNGWKSMIKSKPNLFINGGYLEQAQKFGVQNIDQAKTLMSNKK